MKLNDNDKGNDSCFLTCTISKFSSSTAFKPYVTNAFFFAIVVFLLVAIV